MPGTILVEEYTPESLALFLDLGNNTGEERIKYSSTSSTDRQEDADDAGDAEVTDDPKKKTS